MFDIFFSRYRNVVSIRTLKNNKYEYKSFLGGSKSNIIRDG